MSLLDNGPHELIVTPVIQTTDRYGEDALRDGDPVAVAGCSMQSMTAEERDEAGVQAATAYRVIARAWPGGISSHAVVVHGPPGTDGRTFDQQGEARGYGMSPRTAHVDVVLTARGAEVK